MLGVLKKKAGFICFRLGYVEKIYLPSFSGGQLKQVCCPNKDKFLSNVLI